MPVTLFHAKYYSHEISKQTSSNSIEKLMSTLSRIVDGGNGFNLNDGIQITSYQYASKNSELVKQIKWDMVVIDEAHKLRNVYKQNNVIAKNIKNATDNC